MAERDNKTLILLPLVAGLAGALTALLLAPKSGAETRQDLRDAATDLRERAADGLDTARSTAEEGLERAKGVKRRLSKIVNKKPASDNLEDITTTQDSMPSTMRQTWEEEV